jgi:hypothetical protein
VPFAVPWFKRHQTLFVGTWSSAVSTAGETSGGVRQTVGEHDKPTIGSRANFFGKRMSTIRAQIDRR